MPDISIRVPGDGPAPHGLLLPGSVELLLKEAKASFNGSGAAGAYLPALQLLDDAGNVVGTFPTDSSVAAGASADVSFFPRGKAASGGAAATDETFAIAYRSGFNAPISGGAGSNDVAPWDYIDSNDGNVDLDASGRTRILAAGLYACNFHLEIYDAVWAAPVWWSLDASLVTGGAGNQLSGLWPGINQNFPGWTDNVGNYEIQLSMLLYANIVTPPEALRWRLMLGTGAGAHVATSTFAVVSLLRLGAPSPGGVS